MRRDERDAALEHWFKVVRPELVNRPADAIERGLAEQLEANARVLQREIGDAVPRMTADLRGKLMEMAHG